MNADNHLEIKSSEEDEMDVGSADVRTQEEEEEKGGKTPFTENRLHLTEGMIKTETEDIEDNELYYKVEKEREVLLKEEETEGASEDGMEERFEEERTEEDDEEQKKGDEEEDTLNEPQDLSLSYYSKYESAILQDAHAAAAESAEGPHTPGATGPRVQATGKLNCDICGLSCVSINVLLVHKRSHTGERPFHCSQCGASFTQKGNLLRHIKLHSGEKPFKCPMCSYACRRRDALSGHLRTHSVEKPFKCTHCSRSYKQRSSLEEHRERCHVYIQSRGPADRGDNGVCLDLSFNRELIHQAEIKERPPGSPGPDAHLQQQPVLSIKDEDGAAPHRAFSMQLSHSEIKPIGITNGHKMGMPLVGLQHSAQPPLCMDSFHNDSPQISQPFLYNLGHLLGALNHQNGVSPHPPTQTIPMAPLEGMRMAQADGEAGLVPGAVYPCSHCRVIFLDYVMFTIHMGCHGFRDPLECNVCGHRSHDRYEFSSHIVRGEHRLELK
uniref:Zinc finger protein Aiolos-like n=1 Tax=Cynoglossus semilaevis TaxID=244447 RepID=A0A3P8W7I7_CYNSE